MPLNANYVDKYGQKTTAHTFPLDFSRPFMVQNSQLWRKKHGRKGSTLAYQLISPSTHPLPTGFLFAACIPTPKWVCFFLIPLFYFSHIPQAPLSKFELGGHFYTYPNQKDDPPTFNVSYSEPLPNDAVLVGQQLENQFRYSRERLLE